MKRLHSRQDSTIVVVCCFLTKNIIMYYIGRSSYQLHWVPIESYVLINDRQLSINLCNELLLIFSSSHRAKIIVSFPLIVQRIR